MKDRARDTRRSVGSFEKMGAALGFTRQNFVQHQTVPMSHGTTGVNSPIDPEKGYGSHTRVIKKEHKDGYPTGTKNPEGFALGSGHVKIK